MNKDDVTAENRAAVRRLLDDDDEEEEEEGKEEGSSPRPSRGGVLGDAIQYSPWFAKMTSRFDEMKRKGAGKERAGPFTWTEHVLPNPNPNQVH